MFAVIRLQRLEGHKMYYFKNGDEGELEDIASMHVDNFNLAGKPRFLLLGRDFGLRTSARLSMENVTQSSILISSLMTTTNT